ncbi:MAG: TRAP transporter small permease [Pseudomonadota bacterium]
MAILRGLVAALGRINSTLNVVLRQLGWLCVAAMVAIILTQVVFRYVLNSPLNWTEEAARFLMLWLIAFMAPSAYRWGGFVSIDMLADALPPRLREILVLLLTSVATLVLVVLVSHAIDHFNAGTIFKSAALKIPLKWVYLSLGVCFGLMLLVNIELWLRSLGRLLGIEAGFEPPQMPADIQAE